MTKPDVDEKTLKNITLVLFFNSRYLRSFRSNAVYGGKARLSGSPVLERLGFWQLEAL